MQLPEQFYFSLKSFNESYKKDFEVFKSETGNDVDKRIYDAFLLEKHEEILGLVEQFEINHIEYKIIDERPRTLGEIQNTITGFNSISYKDLGQYFQSKEDALSTFKNSTIRIFDYDEIEFLLGFYNINDKGALVFDDYGFIHFKLGIQDVIELLNKEQLKSKSFISEEPQAVNTDPLDFNLNQTDLVHFFDLLVDADVIKEPNDEAHKTKGGFYGKLAQYFTAKGKVINPKSAKVVKTNKELKGSSYSDSYYKMLKSLQKTIQKKLDS